MRQGYRLKVLFVDQTGQFGGGERSLYDIVTHLPQGHEVALFSSGPFYDALRAGGVSVHLIEMHSAGNVRRDRGTWSLVAPTLDVYRLQRRIAAMAKRFDVLYANSQKAFVVSSLAVRNPRKALVWHLRDLLTSDHFSPVLRRFVVFLANRYASVVIVNSQATGEAFIRSGGKRRLVRVVHNGIDPAPFATVDAGTAHAARKQFVADGAFLVGIFGRLAPWKGQHIMLEALARLPDVHVVFVGEALFGEESYAAALRSKCQEAGLHGRVHFAGFRNDIPVLMQAVDMVAHTSVSPEPFGRVIVEGMLAGRPVVATRAGGVLEIIDDERTGILVEPGNPVALARAIKRIQDDRELAVCLARNGQSKARSAFSVEAMLSTIRATLCQVTNEHQAC